MELFALLLPILIDYINLKVGDTYSRLWISVGICAVVAIFFTWIQTSFHFLTLQAGFDYITHEIMIVFGIAQLSFQAVWSKTDKHDQLRATAIVNSTEIDEEEENHTMGSTNNDSSK